MDGSANAGYDFYSEYEHAVDDKGRIVMPLAFRAPLGDEFVVTRGPDHSIRVYPMPVWEPMKQKLKAAPNNKHTILLRRNVLGSCSHVTLDPQSRLAIPRTLRDYAGISQSQTAVILGEGDYLEIFAKGTRDSHGDEFTTDAFDEASDAIGMSEADDS